MLQELLPSFFFFSFFPLFCTEIDFMFAGFMHCLCSYAFASFCSLFYRPAIFKSIKETSSIVLFTFTYFLLIIFCSFSAHFCSFSVLRVPFRGWCRTHNLFINFTEMRKIVITNFSCDQTDRQRCGNQQIFCSLHFG